MSRAPAADTPALAHAASRLWRSSTGQLSDDHGMRPLAIVHRSDECGQRPRTEPNQIEPGRAGASCRQTQPRSGSRQPVPRRIRTPLVLVGRVEEAPHALLYHRHARSVPQRSGITDRWIPRRAFTTVHGRPGPRTDQASARPWRLDPTSRVPVESPSARRSDANGSPRGPRVADPPHRVVGGVAIPERGHGRTRSERRHVHPLRASGLLDPRRDRRVRARPHVRADPGGLAAAHATAPPARTALWRRQGTAPLIPEPLRTRAGNITGRAGAAPARTRHDQTKILKLSNGRSTINRTLYDPRRLAGRQVRG